MSSELWLKLVEHEYFTKKLPHQYGRLKERFEEFKRQGELDQTISPEKMAEIIIDFIKKEDERKEAEEEKASKRREKRYMKLVEKRINDIKSIHAAEECPFQINEENLVREKSAFNGNLNKKDFDVDLSLKNV